MALIRMASAALDDAITALFNESRHDDMHPRGDSGDDIALATRHGSAALHLCLSSAAGLLESSEAILKQRNSTTSLPCVQTLLRLSDEAEIAGRAAHRAAIVLTDLLAGPNPSPL